MSRLPRHHRVFRIDPDTRGTTTVREQLDRHRADASCAACHAKIDPPGFALEAFDPIGGLRSRYRSSGKGEEPPEKGRHPWRVTYKLGPNVDASGVLVDGRTFDGPASLADLLAAESKNWRSLFYRICLDTPRHRHRIFGSIGDTPHRH